MAVRKMFSGVGKFGIQTMSTAKFLGERKLPPWREHCSYGMTSHHRWKFPPSRVKVGNQAARLSVREACGLLRKVDMENELPGTMVYGEFLNFCKHLGMASCYDDAKDLVASMDKSGTVLTFRNKVFVRPEQVAGTLSKAILLPLSLDDPRREELSRMEIEKAEIDRIAYGRVRGLLWTGLVVYTFQTAVCFRLTFWELSWDVMEPITFFITNTTLLLAGYLFFLTSNRDLSYGHIARTIFHWQQKKLMRKRKFDIARYKELQMQCYGLRWRRKEGGDYEERERERETWRGRLTAAAITQY